MKLSRQRNACWFAVLIAAAGLLAYQNSFEGVFVFDDSHAIVQNEPIRRLWPPWEAMFEATKEDASVRPVVGLSLAINYALSGLDPWSYHAFNLLIHLLAGLALFGIVRRTGGAGLAFAIALLWTVHPLQTASVTYLIQRAESLMGLFYLLTLYCVIRSAASRHPARWKTLAVALCALGMGTKEVMVTAPLMVFLYDRVFLAASFREVLRRRKGFYLALAGTWAIWGSLLVFSSLRIKERTVGFGIPDLEPLNYFLTQPGVILHYLRLAFWPHPLVLDYGWPLVKNFTEAFLPLLAVLVLVAATCWAFYRRPSLGFLGVWFFGILTPTSSVIPLADPIFEHRMYLPLAGVVTLAVAAVKRLLTLSHSSRLSKSVGLFLAGSVALTFITLTVCRNADYHSAIRIWQDTLAKRSANTRAHDNLGQLYMKEGKPDKALTHFLEMVRLAPEYPHHHNNAGIAFKQMGRYEDAIGYFRNAVKLDPEFIFARRNWGLVLMEIKRYEEAIEHFREAVRIQPDFAEAHRDLAITYFIQERFEPSILHSRKALELNPRDAYAHNALGGALAKLGRVQEAVRHFETALRLKPDYEEARQNLNVLRGEVRLKP